MRGWTRVWVVLEEGQNRFQGLAGGVALWGLRKPLLGLGGPRLAGVAAEVAWGHGGGLRGAVVQWSLKGNRGGLGWPEGRPGGRRA